MGTENKRVVGTSKGPSRIVVKVSDFQGIQPPEIIVEQPPSLDERKRGASPSDHMLAGLVGSLNWLGYLIADEMKFTIHRLEIAAEGDFDPHTVWGESYDRRAGFQAIKVFIDIDADTTPDRLELWRKALRFRCPITDNLVNITPIKIRFNPVANNTHPAQARPSKMSGTADSKNKTS